MSSALATLTAVREAGLGLTVENGALRCRSTPSPEFLERLRTHKAELLGLLTGTLCRRWRLVAEEERHGARAAG
jgi:hypothetical protein